MTTILVTGGAGFIGSNFIKHSLKTNESISIINFDKLTYAGNPDNLLEVSKNARYTFIKGDIADEKLVRRVFEEQKIDIVINFAAETHVDRSIGDPSSFVKTDVLGTYVLLENAKHYGIRRFIQISTDEVYGSIPEGAFTEASPLMPTNPYSASKAGADRLVYSYWATYGIDVIITRASNNFGPNQYPEKVIPLFVTNALEDKPLPLYGDGKNIRDWLFVIDHCEALLLLLDKGKPGEVYNIGGGNEVANIDLTHTILEFLDKPHSLITPVKDRPGHDRRYALDCSKMKRLGWKPRYDFQEALKMTIDWYRENRWWWEKLKSGEYKEYYLKHYGMEL